MRLSTYSRLLSDREVSLRPSQLLPLDVQANGVQGRLDYLTETADRVFVLALQDFPQTASTMEVDDLLTARGYTLCGHARENAEFLAAIYGRSPEICTQVVTQCGGATGLPPS